MNILILGAGGRENTLAWKIKQSNKCDKLFIAPGNGGTRNFGENVNISVLDFASIKNLCIKQNIEMVVVGPEDPLVEGVFDYFKNDALLNKIIVVGPSKYAAQLEGSKAFCKAFMQRHHIPTASYKEFTKKNFEEGITYLQNHTLPIVLKADGLAAGKGVIICVTLEEALHEFGLMIQDEKFGKASSKVVVEEFLDGIEMSVFALTNGKEYVLLPGAKDYKRIGEGDTGLNTGGMGAISPVPFADDIFMQKVISQIVEPTIKGLEKDNFEYFGFVFFGLIKVNNEPMVIEYNCRLGDPETEVVLPRLENDLVELFIANNNFELNKIGIKHSALHAATVMCVSGGYPVQHKNGYEITSKISWLGDQQNESESNENTMIFQAGTKFEDGKIVTNGGRVLAITSMENTLKQAVENSIAAAEKINYTDKYFRRDIGWEFI
jgi:phosphoribosylamine---glycine ligase